MKDPELLLKEKGWTPIYCEQCGSLLSIGLADNFNVPTFMGITYACPVHGELGIRCYRYEGLLFQADGKV